MKKKELDEILEKIVNSFAKREINIKIDHTIPENILTYKKDYCRNNLICVPGIIESAKEDPEKIAKAKAFIDMAVLYKLFENDYDINIKNILKSEEEFLIYDNFQKVRSLILIRNRYLGIFDNIINRINSDLLNIVDIDYKFLPLYLLLDFIDKDYIKNNFQDFLSKNFSELYPFVIDLNNYLDNPNLYSKKIVEIINYLLVHKKKDSKKDFSSKENFERLEDVNINNENITDLKNTNKTIEYEYAISEEEGESRIVSEFDFIQRSKYEKNVINKTKYKIYSDEFDEIVIPSKKIELPELKNLREQLDKKFEIFESTSRTNRNKFRQKIISKKNNISNITINNNILNKKKLTQFIINSNKNRDIWIEDKKEKYNDTVISILIDNSGSMRGGPIVTSAAACEIIAKLLEEFSVNTEIIGFTTSEWKGGRVKKMWEINNKPVNPGRLNEVRYIIYKSFKESYKKAKINLGYVLKEGILKENIDGEALLFAKSRLDKISCSKKILIIISDGMPIDDSTTANNEKNYLETHLKYVVKFIEKRTNINLIAIGIGHDLQDIYKNNITIDNSKNLWAKNLGDVMIEKIIEIL